MPAVPGIIVEVREESVHKIKILTSYWGKEKINENIINK